VGPPREVLGENRRTTVTVSTTRPLDTQATDDAVRPFRAEFPDEALDDLRRRIAAVSVFPRELYQAPRSWAERAYPKLFYFNEVTRGNHFAAWQKPELFTTEVRAAFQSLR
jgi:hypothetical protein